MARKLRVALISAAILLVVAMASLWGLYLAVRQVRPFYQQALDVNPQSHEAGRRELESRASALISDTRSAGQWHAQFTDEQINGWLATELKNRESDRTTTLRASVSEPRVAISPGVLTLGFRALQGGIETIISVDATVSLTDEGAVAVQLKSVRAGALPLPVMQVADKIATACRELNMPVRWMQNAGEPVAIVTIENGGSPDRRRLEIDVIELNDGELYIAGHTSIDGAETETDPLASGPRKRPKKGHESAHAESSVELTDYELELSPEGATSAFKLTRDRSTADDTAPKSTVQHAAKTQDR